VPNFAVLRVLFALYPSVVAAQWSYGSAGTIAELRGLSIARDGSVWVSGVHGTFARSTDRGRSWSADSVSGSALLDFRSLHAWDGATAIVASAGEAERGLARILSTADSGRRWTPRYSSDEKGVFLDAIAFWDARNGIALSDPVDGAFVILLTADAGATWNRVPAASLPPTLAGEAAFAASNGSIALSGDSLAWIGTGGGGRARVFQSRDRGATWKVVDTPIHADGPASGIFALAFFDARRGIAVGGDYTKRTLPSVSAALTFDGGETWSPASLAPAAYLSSVSYAESAEHLLAVGLAGTYVSYDGGWSWMQTDTVPLNAVRFRGGQGYAVGPHGRIAVTDSREP
jgi:photosystem II stability/assembly factor-like uncharacterized protein